MHWQLKGLVQKVVGAMPAGVTLNYWLQRRFGGLRDFPGEFTSKVEDWTIMTRHLRDAGRSLTGARLLEIGTGWYPTFPLACYLAGARQVSTFDLNRHLKPELTRACIALLGEHLPTIAAESGEPLAEVERRYAILAAHPDPAGDRPARPAASSTTAHRPTPRAPGCRPPASTWCSPTACSSTCRRT